MPPHDSFQDVQLKRIIAVSTNIRLFECVFYKLFMYIFIYFQNNGLRLYCNIIVIQITKILLT